MRGGRSRADYNEWGEITYREALDITSSYRRIYPQSNYTGHDWDDVLGMYYAKARFYSAEDKRFVAMDPIKGSITEPLSLVPYLYCVDNPLRYVDPLGMAVYKLGETLVKTIKFPNNSINTKLAKLDDLVVTYGFSDLTYNRNTGRYRSNHYSGNRLDTYIEYQPDSGVKIIQVGDRTGQNSRTIPWVGRSHYASNAPLTEFVEQIDGSAYVDINYFHQLMCELGYSKKLELVEETSSELISRDFIIMTT